MTFKRVNDTKPLVDPMMIQESVESIRKRISREESRKKRATDPVYKNSRTVTIDRLKVIKEELEILLHQL